MKHLPGHPINATRRLWFKRAMETRGVAIAYDETGGITKEEAPINQAKMSLFCYYLSRANRST